MQMPKQMTSSSYDYLLLWITLALLGLGLVMVYSASIAIAEANASIGHQSTYYLMRQAIFIGISLVAAYVAFQVPMEWWQKMAPHLFLLAIGLLILVLIPGVGRNINGSQRWLSLFVINLQPSEFMKLFAAMYVADYAVRKSAQMDSIVKGFLPMVAVMVLVGFLLLREPDFGALAVVASISISILWLAGINVWVFIGLLAVLPVAVYFLIVSSPYRLQRVIGFMDPWADPFGKGYQLSHALIAFGRGEWFGVGLGASVEKLLYLPEAHTDFLFAVIAEELGFVGVVTVLFLFSWLIIRAFGIGKEAAANEQYFSALLAQGIGVWIGGQAIINIGVNMGVLPTKGLTLPLLSFGGSGILANCIAIAVLLRIDYENRLIQKGLRV
ncbi:MAG: putative lipid II flippase FtsW [Betaproteobacteria bacterium]|nr:putative lipid II flippase FtsW [Betaproteobacteria bacterium]MCH9849845.1 putative lipid II flippase FtsW [Betaproteobacteria bacterium]